jgi:hypothetical protein
MEKNPALSDPYQRSVIVLIQIRMWIKKIKMIGNLKIENDLRTLCGELITYSHDIPLTISSKPSRDKFAPKVDSFRDNLVSVDYQILLY